MPLRPRPVIQRVTRALLLGLVGLSACDAAASGSWSGAADSGALSGDTASDSTDNPAADAGIGAGAPVSPGLEAGLDGSAVFLRRTLPSDHAHHCLVLSQPTTAGGTLTKKLCSKTAGSDTWRIGDASGASPWSTLSGLREGPATWQIWGGASASKTDALVGEGTLRVGPYFDGPCTAALATASGWTQWHATAPAELDVALALGADVQPDADIITPATWVETVRLTGKPKTGNTVQLRYTATKPGLYVFEVNNLSGGAVLNCPVYVGADIPLVPVQIASYVSGNAAALPDAERDAMRDELLGLINAARGLVALSPLAPHDTLTRMAQDHTDDMLARGYFGHYTPEGVGPGGRAAAAGWKGSIGENVAAHAKLEGAHAGLWWSAAHRKNLLGSFQFVGLGIGRASNGLLYVTENFGSP